MDLKNVEIVECAAAEKTTDFFSSIASRHFSAKTFPVTAMRSNHLSVLFSDISDGAFRLFKLTRYLLSAAFPTTFDIRHAVIDSQYSLALLLVNKENYALLASLRSAIFTGI